MSFEPVVAVVEDVSAVSCIDEIAATPGLDVLFIGTSDLSFSLGVMNPRQLTELSPSETYPDIEVRPTSRLKSLRAIRRRSPFSCTVCCTASRRPTR